MSLKRYRVGGVPGFKKAWEHQSQTGSWIFQQRAFAQSLLVNYLYAVLSMIPCFLLSSVPDFRMVQRVVLSPLFLLSGSLYCTDKCSESVKRLSFEARAGIFMRGKMMWARLSLNNLHLWASAGQRRPLNSGFSGWLLCTVCTAGPTSVSNLEKQVRKILISSVASI